MHDSQKIRAIIMALLFVTPVTVAAQNRMPSTMLKSLPATSFNANNYKSLLDPNHFTMKNQYIMSYSSSGGSGDLIGTYINTMEYQFNTPLTVRLKVAYQASNTSLFSGTSSVSGPLNSQNGRLSVPAFDVVYKPWKNTTLSFHYRDMSFYNPYYGSQYGYGGYGYRSRYSRSPFMW